jgi:MFS family permease
MSSPQNEPPLRLPFHYAWIAVFLSFATTLVGAGIRSSPSVLIHPLELEFGWNRAAIASAVSLNLLLYGCAAPISGRLLDRFGPRRVMLGSLLTLALAVAGTTVMTELWHLLVLWGVVVGLSAGATSSILAASVTHRWFVARRGLVLGILNSATSTGQLVFLPILMYLIVAAGWRMGSLLLVGAAMALVILVMLLMRDDPAEVGLRPYGEGTGASEAGRAALRHQRGAATVPMREVVTNPTFWLLCSSYFICGATANGLVGTHLLPHAIDHGVAEVTAATTLGIMGGMNFVGTILSGWLTDRVNPRKVLALVYALRGTSLFLLPFLTWSPGLFIFAVIYGLDWFATVPATVTITGETFGKQNVGSVYGWIFLAHQTGAAVASLGGGLIRVWLGDYQVAFFIGGTLGLVAAGLALSMPLPERRPAARPVPSPAA